MRGNRLHWLIAAVILALLYPCSLMVAASPAESESGDLTARITDEKGQPLSGILVSLQGASQDLPILARTNASGLVFLKDIASGTYEILVRSGRFRNARDTDIQIRPGRTELVTVMLQQILGVEIAEDQNLNQAAFFRGASQRRVVFRSDDNGDIGGETLEWGRPSRAVLNVTSSPGLGGDYLVFPADSASSTITNFAVENPLGFSGSSVLAGQLSSGEDSMWRLKNFINYQMSERHSLQVYIGYGRLSFDQPHLTLGDSPLQGGGADLSQISGPLRSLSLGLQDRWDWGRTLTLEWGFELNQVRAHDTHNFASPNVSLSFEPREGTEFRLLAASKRDTVTNSLALPSGDSINLSDSFYVSRVGDEFRLGTTRYQQASLRQQVGESSFVEAAVFSNEMDGAGRPFAVDGLSHGLQVLQLDGRQADTSGYRLIYERRINDHLKASVTYLYSRAYGLDEEGGPLQAVGYQDLASLFRRHGYHSLATQVDAYLPFSKTTVTALVKLVPEGNPIPSLDAYSDRYQTSNESVNVFVRQILPMPQGLFDFLGLDFLTPQHIEALLDVRNLTNQDVGTVETPMGDLVLLQNPRTVRGGIAVRF
ncbi:MAG TPA: carboxypeptidase-like regulatory domain-containing protein [Acidobacteriota bacterium]|nr:carboxypeptidase-like regulatory domain-containing protein [Acidobacteriota bacterium]